MFFFRTEKNKRDFFECEISPLTVVQVENLEESEEDFNKNVLRLRSREVFKIRH